MKTNKNITFAIALFIVVLTSCKKDVDPGGTAVEAMAGDWYVRAYDANGQLMYPNFFAIHTYNTAANTPTEMWFDDHFWGTKFKVAVNVPALTFGGPKVKNSDPTYNVDITVSNGKILLKGTKGPASKSPTDSIYYEVEYSDDPGTKYYMAGYKRTGFEADDH